MSLSPAMIGALVGAVIGLLFYASLRALAARIETMKDAADPKTTAKALRIAAIADLVIFPVAGFFVGPIVLQT